MSVLLKNDHNFEISTMFRKPAKVAVPIPLRTLPAGEEEVALRRPVLGRAESELVGNDGTALLACCWGVQTEEQVSGRPLLKLFSSFVFSEILYYLPKSVVYIHEHSALQFDCLPTEKYKIKQILKFAMATRKP